MEIADLLTADRINWTRIEDLGGDFYAIWAEAVGAGDTVLERRAKRAIARRQLRWFREGH